MTIRSCRFAVFVAAMTITIGAHAFTFPKFNKSKSGDYCRDELEELLQKKYGPDVVVTDAKGLGSGEQWVLWATSNMCHGWIAATFVGEKWNCKQGNYGKRPHTLIGAYGHSDECKELIPRTIYW